MLRVLRRVFRLSLGLSLAAAACRPPARAPEPAPESRAECAARQRSFSAFLQNLPERSVNATIGTMLPETTLGTAPGSAPVLELAERGLVLDGRAVPAQRLEERLAAVAAWARALPPPSRGQAGVYVAAARETDVRTLRAYLEVLPPGLEPRLLVATVGAPAPDDAASDRARSLAEGLLKERDPAARVELAARGYDEFSDCAALDLAVRDVSGIHGHARWPALRRSLLEAVPRCDCAELDTRSLSQLVTAEQRAGAATLGVLPLEFLRDVRCGASMPLRSISKLVRQMEAFDREFAGRFGKDALEFGDVLANERLLNYFCNALPGETLAAEQRRRATVYLRRGSGAACEGWRFEPLAPGAPMGTLRRVSGGSGPLSVHYRQAAEELHLFGPVSDPASRATDEREWPCRQRLRLAGVDARSVELETGRWFFDEASCQAAPPPPAAPSGCFATLGEPEPASADAAPGASP